MARPIHAPDHTDELGRLAEEFTLIKLSAKFKGCIVSHVANNQLHDVEIRRKDEQSTKGICRIQVKATARKLAHWQGAKNVPRYVVTIQHGRNHTQQYEKGDVDFFIVFICAENEFYVVPADRFLGKTAAVFFVGCDKPKKRGSGLYEKYLGAWDLIGDFLGIPNEAKTEVQSKQLLLDEG